MKPKKLTVHSHALERWKERFPNRNIDQELATAIPYGAQRGNAQLLKNNDAVFVVEKNLVVTCLTLEQAIANMQMKGVQFSESPTEAKPVQPQEVTEAPKKPEIKLDKLNIRSLKESIDSKTAGLLNHAICNGTDEELRELSKIKGATGLFEHVLKWRAFKRKQQIHNDRQEAEMIRLKDAVRRMFGEAALLKLYADIEKRKEMECNSQI